MSEADWVQLRTFRSLVGQQAPLCSLVITPCDSQPSAASCPAGAVLGVGVGVGVGVGAESSRPYP